MTGLATLCRVPVPSVRTTCSHFTLGIIQHGGHRMSDVSIVRHGWLKAIVAIGLMLMVGQTLAEGATARAAKDASERSRAVTAAARHLQGQGFTDPMLAAENVDNSQLTVEVDN